MPKDNFDDAHSFEGDALERAGFKRTYQPVEPDEQLLFGRAIAKGLGSPATESAFHFDGPGEVAVQPPNSPPTGTRFDTSTEIYVGTSPDVPVPQWLMDEADKMARERGEQPK